MYIYMATSNLMTLLIKCSVAHFVVKTMPPPWVQLLCLAYHPLLFTAPELPIDKILIPFFSLIFYLIQQSSYHLNG